MTYDPLPPFRRDFDAARDPYTARNALGITGQTIATTPLTVSQLPPATGNAGMRAFVLDSTTTTFHAAVAGGGTNKIGVVCDGVAWLVG